MIDEISSLGFDTVELGYALSRRTADGIIRLANAGRVKISSLHAYCPIQRGQTPTPEPCSICDLSGSGRSEAVSMTVETGRFAADAGIPVVVLHAGRIPMRRKISKLMTMAEEYGPGEKRSWWFRRLNSRMMSDRDRNSEKYMARLRMSLDEMLPVFENLGVKLALENLPTYDGIPNEPEMQYLFGIYESPSLGCWYDIGHGQVRENLGWISNAGVASRFKERIAGMHLHDVVYPCADHRMPPGGCLRFEAFAKCVPNGIPLVLEPSPACSAGSVAAAAEYVCKVWNLSGGRSAPARTEDHKAVESA